jgi:hypothetical protein
MSEKYKSIFLIIAVLFMPFYLPFFSILIDKIESAYLRYCSKVNKILKKGDNDNDEYYL